MSDYVRAFIFFFGVITLFWIVCFAPWKSAPQNSETIQIEVTVDGQVVYSGPSFLAKVTNAGPATEVVISKQSVLGPKSVVGRYVSPNVKISPAKEKP